MTNDAVPGGDVKPPSIKQIIFGNEFCNDTLPTLSILMNGPWDTAGEKVPESLFRPPLLVAIPFGFLICMHQQGKKIGSHFLQW